MPEILTLNEVADLARVSPYTVRYWRQIGHGPTGFKLGRRVVYDAAEVRQWIADQRDAAQRLAG